MKITSKGQVTIPQEIRVKAGLLPNTEVKFEYVRGKVMLVPVGGNKTRGASVVMALRGTLKHLGMTTDEIMEFTRGEK